MKFTDSHEWVELEKDPEKGFSKEGSSRQSNACFAKVGISNFAQKELGQVVYVELPIIGQRVEAGEEVVILESTKAAVDIYSPVSGEIVAVNEALCKQLNLLNQDPQGEGWLYKIRLSHPDELLHLLSKEQYEELIV